MSGEERKGCDKLLKESESKEKSYEVKVMNAETCR